MVGNGPQIVLKLCSCTPISLGSYRRPRMTEESKEIDFDGDHRRVGRLMGQNGISVIRVRKQKVKRDSNHKFNIAELAVPVLHCSRAKPEMGR